MNATQKAVYDALTPDELDTGNQLEIVQSPPNIDSPLPVNDLAVGVFGALGMTAASLATDRGLPAQQVRVDRWHAGNTLNSVAWHFQNGWQLDIHVVHSAINGFFQSKDGRHIIYNGAYPHLRQIILDYLGCPNQKERITEATATHNAFALEQELSDLGACIAVVRSADEWAAHPQGQHLASVPPIEIIKLAHSDPRPFPGGATRPLSGIRAIDLSKVLAGPTLGRQLAEHGAQVIHARHPYQDLIYPFDIETSYGKVNSYLDFTRPRSRERLLDLAREADVFSQGYRYGSLHTHGFGPEALAKENPHLIYVQLNAYGFGGPWAYRHGFEQLAQSVTGAAAVNGGTLTNPKLVPAYMNDYLTGFLGALGTMIALRRRAQEGGAWLVKVSLARTCQMALDLPLRDASEALRPTNLEDLGPWLIDQDSPLGVLTRLKAPIEYSETPCYAAIPATAPGAHEPEWREVTVADCAHRPTRMLDRLELLGNMALH